MSSPLVPCPTCRRHVRAAGSCPFCAAALPHDLALRAIPGAPSRLGRSALVAFAVSVSACSSTTDGGVITDTGPVKTDGAADGAVDDTGNPAAAYGAPADAVPADTSKQDTAGDDVAPMPAYGLPPSDTGSGG